MRLPKKERKQNQLPEKEKEKLPPPRSFSSEALLVTVTKRGEVTKAPYTAPETATQPPDSDAEIGGRFLIIEADESAKEYLKRQFRLEVAPSFDRHFQDNESLATAELDPENVASFFARWPAMANQEEAAYNIGERIRANKPYDVDTIDDPKNLNLGHNRYYNWPERPFRSYDPISTFEVEIPANAAEGEKTSVISDGGKTAIVSEEERTGPVSNDDRAGSTSVKKKRFSHAAKQCMSLYTNVGNNINGKIRNLYGSEQLLTRYRTPTSRSATPAQNTQSPLSVLGLCHELSSKGRYRSVFSGRRTTHRSTRQ